MAESSKSFPHPVAGNGDDTTGPPPTCSLDWQVAGSKLLLTFANLQTHNNRVEDLISAHSAGWIARAYCPRTYYRREFLVTGPSTDLEIPTGTLDGDVDFETYVIATKDLQDYLPDQAHGDYDGTQFQLDAGSLLALGPKFRVSLDIEFDPLKAPVSSFLKVREGTAPTGPMRIIWDDDDIILELSQADWKIYPMLKQDALADVLHAAMVFPALIEAIHRLSDDSVKDRRWAQRLQSILDAKGLDSSAPDDAAQQLLDMPVSRALKAMHAIKAEE